MMINKPARQHGFSLLELMTTITVAAILLVIAVPSFRDVIHRNQVSSASNEILASLAYARTEAITRGQLVSLCPSADGASCTAGGQAFAPGWLVYTYPAGVVSANKAYDSTKSILLRATTARTGVSIQSRSAEIVTFGQQGQLKSATTSPTLTIVACYSDSTSSRNSSSTTVVPGIELDVNGSGSVQTKTLAAGASCTPS
jgi:type IV fimbrial biogenesis protein FimT